MVDAIHEEGALCVKHSDGNLYPILDMIVSAGPDGLNPIEPVAGMELGKTRKLVGRRLCLIGNIDCSRLLPYGTPAEVREAVRQAIAEAAPGGGFIVSSSNSFHSSCRPENLKAMVDATHEFGRYA
jgi:uroporphyrinogen decarboxylase